MALFQDHAEVKKVSDQKFDETYPAGSETPVTGIYICVNCRDEIVAQAGNPLPPQNHAQHPDTGKPVLWKLLVMAQIVE